MLKIESLSISFKQYNRCFSQHFIHPIRCIDLSLKKGEVLSVVGASGAGKSLVAHALLGLLPKNASLRGRIWFEDKELTPDRMKALRGKKITMIPQSISCLNPLLRVQGQVERAAVLSGKSNRQARMITTERFNQLGLEKTAFEKYPFEISGGMARRVLCAAASVQSAEMIIADEPTKGLDQKRLENLLNDLKTFSKRGRAVLMITHDLSAALKISDKIVVFKDGMTVEMALGSPDEKGISLKHPYSRMLFSSLPQNDFMMAVNGSRHDRSIESGCTFFSACPSKEKRCCSTVPPITTHGNGWVRCYHA